MRRNTVEKVGAALRAQIDHNMKFYGINVNDLAKRMNLAKPTVYVKLRNPERMSIEEMMRMGQILHFKLEIHNNLPTVVIGEM